MTTKTPSEQADEIVEMFRDCIDDYPVECTVYCSGGDIEREPASVSLAILHVTGIIEVLERCKALDHGFVLRELNEHKQILDILKSKL